MIKAEKSYEIDYVSASGGNNCERCPARFFFKNLCRLEQRDRNTTPMTFGKCMHIAIPDAFEDPEKASQTFDRVWKKETKIEDDKRNSFRAAAMLNDFHKSHHGNYLYKPLDPPSGIVESTEKYSDFEAPFLVDVGGDYPIYGKIDRLVKWNDKIWPLDYKCASFMTGRTFENFRNSVQTLMYTVAATHLTGERAPGMLVEKLRVSASKAECMLHPLYVSDKWIENFGIWIVGLMSRIKRWNIAGYWPQRPTGCAPYGSFGVYGYPCEYLTLCELDNWRDGMKFYAVNEWNPLKSSTKVKENSNESK